MLGISDAGNGVKNPAHSKGCASIDSEDYPKSSLSLSK